MVDCAASYNQRFRDAGVDMGTGYDCLDELSHNDNRTINPIAVQQRIILKTLMENSGFVPYEKEWWHFTLKNEPYPDNYFNFPITAPR